MSLGEGFENAIAAARVGDEAAVAAIYRDLQPALLAFLKARHPSQGEDIASETWMHVATGLGRFKGDERGFRAWVFTIARRRLIEVRRRDGARPTVPLSDEILSAAGDVGDVEEEAVQALSYGEALLRIAELPATQAEVVLLRVIGDLSVDEVARVMGKRGSAVRALQHRAIKRLAHQTSRQPVT